MLDPAARVLGVIDIPMALEGVIRSTLKKQVRYIADMDLKMDRRRIEKGFEEKVGDKTKSFGIRLTKIELMDVFG